MFCIKLEARVGATRRVCAWHAPRNRNGMNCIISRKVQTSNYSHT